jgi:hypothetical protein
VRRYKLTYEKNKFINFREKNIIKRSSVSILLSEEISFLSLFSVGQQILNAKWEHYTLWSLPDGPINDHAALMDSKMPNSDFPFSPT